ncbi:hypothetical protein [Neolewinella persica]|uniref:hypothetical protein n=1 Tax=Neolewinella persica TaxID=70998 RepID=UPI00036E5AFD|nr:hypothetical protein [Neolewinella persica]
MPDLPPPLQTLLNNPQAHLEGTDVRIDLSLGRTLLNEVLAARPADTPVEELFLDPENDNTVNLHLEVKAPVIGLVKRRITFRPGGPVVFPSQPWLHLEITDGFRFMDKPIIKLMQGQIAEKLPRGIELTSDHLRLHVPALLTAAGYQKLVPMIKHLQLHSEANCLVIELHLVA